MRLLESSNLEPTCMHTYGMTSVLCILVAVLDVCLRIMEAKMHQNQLNTMLRRTPSKLFCMLAFSTFPQIALLRLEH